MASGFGAELDADSGLGAELDSDSEFGAELDADSGLGAELDADSGLGAELAELDSGLGAESELGARRDAIYRVRTAGDGAVDGIVDAPGDISMARWIWFGITT